MAKVNALLTKRLKSSDKSKITAMAKRSAEGNLTSFSGLFGNTELNEKEKKIFTVPAGRAFY